MITQQCTSDCFQQWTDLADGEGGALLGAPAHREAPRVAGVAPLQQDTQQLGHHRSQTPQTLQQITESAHHSSRSAVGTTNTL